MAHRNIATRWQCAYSRVSFINKGKTQTYMSLSQMHTEYQTHARLIKL